MVRAQSERVGRGSCLICGEAVTYRRSSGGYLKCQCDADDCDASFLAPKGSGAERKALATIKTREPEPAPAPKGQVPEPQPEPVKTPPPPAPKGPNSVFSLGSLSR